MEPATPLLTAAMTGMGLHMMLSIVYGVLFAWLVTVVPSVRGSSLAAIAAASLFGLLLWLVNFYLLAPPAGWMWFPTKTNPLQQFIAHTFGFGTLLGVYLDRVFAARRQAAPGAAGMARA